MTKKSVLLLALILLLCLAADAFAWNDRLMAQIYYDAAQFAPNRLRQAVGKEAIVMEMEFEKASSRSLAGKDPDRVFAEGIIALQNANKDPEAALTATIDVARLLLAASTPTNNPRLLTTIAISSSCHQAEYDGVDYLPSLSSRITLSKRATANARQAVLEWAQGKGSNLKAAEAVALCYHVAVNDLADAMTTLWKSATGDTARFGTIGRKVWHGKSPEGALSLPRGYDPVPKLADYYKGQGSKFAQRRLRVVGTDSPPPDSIYLIKFPGLKIVTKEGQQLKKLWEKEHEGEKIRTPVLMNEPEDFITEEDTPMPQLPPAERIPDDGVVKKQEHKVNHAPISAVEKKQQGGLSEAAIESTIANKIGVLRYCYEKTVQDTGRVGVITLSFTINLDGSVSAIEVVQDTLHSDALADCLVQTVSGMRFPKPGGKVVRIRYPFVFQ